MCVFSMNQLQRCSIGMRLQLGWSYFGIANETVMSIATRSGSLKEAIYRDATATHRGDQLTVVESDTAARWSE